MPGNGFVPLGFVPLEVVKNTLHAAYRAVHGGGEGLKTVTAGASDLQTAGDKAAGEAMLVYLQGYVSHIGVIYTEEFGRTNFYGGNYSAIIDDIDGTSNFRDGLGMLPHGSIMGVFETRDPAFNDCVAAGFLEFNSGNLFYAERGKGAFLIERWRSGSVQPRRLSTDKSVQLTIENGELKASGTLKMIPNLYMLGSLAGEFASYSSMCWQKTYDSTAVDVALIAAGSAHLFVTADNAPNPKKRKTGEELGPLYMIIKEAGGAMVDWAGNDIGPEKVGMGEKRPWHAVVAASEEMARTFTKHMQLKPAVAEYMRRRGFGRRVADFEAPKSGDKFPW